MVAVVSWLLAKAGLADIRIGSIDLVVILAAPEISLLWFGTHSHPIRGQRRRNIHRPRTPGVGILVLDSQGLITTGTTTGTATGTATGFGTVANMHILQSIIVLAMHTAPLLVIVDTVPDLLIIVITRVAATLCIFPKMLPDI